MKQKFILVSLFLLIFGNELYSQPKITVGLIQHTSGSTDNGYVLFAPMGDTNTYLIDKCGYLLHKWGGNFNPGISVYLLPTGKLLKTCKDESSAFTKAGGVGGIIEIVDWDGNIEWQYKISTPTECQHHAVKYLANGNILVIVWEKKTLEDVILAGRNPESFDDEFWTEKIQELRPIGKDSAEIVWEWKVWDHLIQDFDSTRDNYGKVELHPELIDANYSVETQKVDWHHLNSIDYNPELDQILLSSYNFNEIWIIDHSTTKLEAASHIGGKSAKGGDILYRWGNPRVYRHGTDEDHQLFFQHDAKWIAKGLPYEGCISIFSNLCGTVPNQYSSVFIIKPPVDSTGFYNNDLPYAPKNPDWSYITDDLAINLSSAQILKNGHVIICNGTNGLFFEIDNTKNIVWQYRNPSALNVIIPQGQPTMGFNPVFRCEFYPSDFEGFDGKDLSQKGTIENENKNSDNCSLYSAVKAPELVYPANNANDCLLSEQFKWRKVANAQSYYLQVAKDADFTSIFFEGTAGADTFKLISKMLVKKDYYWHVASVSSEGMSAYSANWKLSTTYKPIVLQTPTDLKVNVYLDTKFTWLPSTAGTQYQIQISKVTDFKSTIADEKVSNKPEFQTTVLESNQSYYWRVRLVIGTSFGLWSDVWSFKTVAKSPELISPADNAVDQSLDTTAYWHKVTYAQSYYIQVAKDVAFTNIFFEGNVGTDTFKLISNMLAQTEYYWHVSAVTTEGTGAYSSAWKFKTAISPVVLQAPLNAEVNLPLATKFTWVAHSGGNQYQIQISKVVNFQTTVVDEKINNKLEFQTRILDYDQTYYWRVRLVLDQSFGQWSPTWSFTTAQVSIVLSNPVNGSANLKIPIELSWFPAATAEYYHLQLSNDANFGNIILDRNSVYDTKYPLTEADITIGTQYFWHIKGVNSQDNIPWSDSWQFTTSAVDVKESEQFTEIKLYPNPSGSKAVLSINYTESSEAKILISSADGKLVKSDILNLKSGETNYIINSDSLSSGTYYITIITPSGFISRELVVNK
ncbi:MAG: aryl-sulfate sulfotransferase [bacterium]